MFGGGARSGERGWGADAHAAEAALSVMRGVDQRPRLGLGDPHGDCASVVADVRDLAVVALVGRAVDSAWSLALRPLRRIFWAAGGENPPPRFSWSTISTRLFLLNYVHYMYYGFTGGAQVVRQMWSVRYQGELLGPWDHAWDPQNRDPRRNSSPETDFRLAYYHPLRWVGSVN